MEERYDRRDFLKLSSALGAGVVLGETGNICQGKKLTGPPPVFKAKPIKMVRVGFVGVGGQGSGHVKNFLNIEGVQVKAVCDILEDKVSRIQQWVQEAGQPKPTGYSRGETDFKRMCENEELDLVVTATPWRWHVPVCVSAMNADKHAATEVPAAVTLDECWQLVEKAEKTHRYCVMLENCCYMRTEMMVLNMVRKGLLGELIHAECGYLHDLRREKFSSKGEGLWRRDHSIKRNGNLYSTHGLGPVAQCMNINRGDQFDYLVSMSSKSRGLNLYAATEFGPDDQRAKQKYALGDVNVSLIRTVNGCTITVYHDCSSPRPYSRINLVQGTKGIFQGYPDRIHIEGRSLGHPKTPEEAKRMRALVEKNLPKVPGGHRPFSFMWEPIDNYVDELEHPLWRASGEKARNFGHGGADYMEDYRLVQALREGSLPDMDVYDAASWSVVSELSEWSVANKSRPIDFPDFTRGQWKNRPPIGIIGA